MATALGSCAGLALAYETSYGTPPAAGWHVLSFARIEYGARQELVEPDTRHDTPPPQAASPIFGHSSLPATGGPSPESPNASA